MRRFFSVVVAVAGGVASAQPPVSLTASDIPVLLPDRAPMAVRGGIARVGGTDLPVSVPAPVAQVPRPPAMVVPADCPPAPAPTTVTASAAPAEPADLTWVTGEYLFSFVKPGNIPFALGSTGPAGGLGVLGTPGTVGVHGPRNLDYGTFAGLRIGGGRWLSSARTFGVEGSVFLLENRSVGDTAVGNPVLARPFFDTSTGTENVRVLTAPGAFAGGLSMSSSSRLWGADAGGVLRLTEGKQAWSLDAVGGFKFLSLEESLQITDFAQVLPGGGVTAFNGVGQAAPARTDVSDFFSTQNRFYGAGLGLRVGWTSERWFGGLTGKASLGTTRQTVNVNGSSTLSGTVIAPATVSGGLLAVNSNIGSGSRNGFSVVPEVSAKLGYRLTQNLSVVGGYQFLYWTNVVRPGDQMSRNLNPTRIPTSINFGVPFGPVQPATPFATTDFWMHGATVGFQLAF